MGVRPSVRLACLELLYLHGTQAPVLIGFSFKLHSQSVFDFLQWAFVLGCVEKDIDAIIAGDEAVIPLLVEPVYFPAHVL